MQKARKFFKNPGFLKFVDFGFDFEAGWIATKQQSPLFYLLKDLR